MTVLCIDFMNMAHRARSGFQAGDYPVVFNFFRQFRALVGQFKPNRVYIALEGKPVARRSSLVEYKANRVVPEDDPRYKALQSFFRQKDIIVDILVNYFPVSVVRHPTSEADDTISNLISNSTSAVPWVVVSSDTDFIQLLQKHSNVRLYNAVQKQFVEAPSDYDYVVWKSLRGDSSDNIPGVPGIGDKTADKIASDPELLSEFVSNPTVAEVFSRNYDLIRFMEWSDEEREQMTCSSPEKNWSIVKKKFQEMDFKSIVKDSSWEKFVGSLDYLWGN